MKQTCHKRAETFAAAGGAIASGANGGIDRL